jgi:hypothetical protein
MARVQEHFKNEFGESVAIRAETKVITEGIAELRAEGRYRDGPSSPRHYRPRPSS